MTEWPGNFPRNRFKQALSSFHRQIGLWSGLCSPIGAEIIAGAGFDWIVIDGEHAPNDIPSLLAQLHAMRGGSAEPVFRVPWNDPVIIKRALDVGARSLLVPFVQNAEEARKAVAAARYPPLGIRGVAVGPRANDYGRIQGYHANAHLDTCVVVQLESKAASKKSKQSRPSKAWMPCSSAPATWRETSVILAIPAILRCVPPSKTPPNASGQQENPQAHCQAVSTQSKVLSLWDSTSQPSEAMWAF
jgi:hypothetical protein